MNIKVLVATHKKYEIPKEKIYLPIHVGKENTDIDFGYIGDNTGENISLKNPNYCELTAIYWAWKNLDADVIGLVHYRRHLGMRKSRDFNDVLNESQIKNIIEKVDIIVPKKRNYFIESNYSHYIHAHPAEPLDETRKIVKEMYPDYLASFDKVMKDSKAHMFNMFIMKKEKFDEYCEWLFALLFELENRIDITSYNSYESRVFGFVSELMLDVWLLKNNYKYKEIVWSHMENEKVIQKAYLMIKRKLNNKANKVNV